VVNHSQQATTKTHRQLAVFPNSHTWHDPRNDWQPALSLFSTFLVGSQTPTNILPLMVGYGVSLLVESRKNGQFFRGIIWWDYLVGSIEFLR
jgi:hypothetical protein